MIIPFQIHTHLFILFSYLFTNLHDLSLSNLHLITYNLHSYYLYKYTLWLPISLIIHSHTFCVSFIPLYTSFLLLTFSFYIPFITYIFYYLFPLLALTEQPLCFYHLCFIFPFLFSYFLHIFTSLNSNQVRFLT